MILIHIYESEYMVKSCINVCIVCTCVWREPNSVCVHKNIAKQGHNCLLFFTEIGNFYNGYCTNNCCTHTGIIFGKVTLLVSIQIVTLSMYVGLVHVCFHYVSWWQQM